jgi:hypothetical protein
MTLAVVLASLPLFLAGPACAAVLVTPPLSAFSGDKAECKIANLSTRTQTVTVDMVDGSGFVFLTSGPIHVAAGRIFLEDSDPSPGPFYCRFTVAGSTLTFRATGSVFDSTNTDKVAVTAH